MAEILITTEVLNSSVHAALRKAGIVVLRVKSMDSAKLVRAEPMPFSGDQMLMAALRGLLADESMYRRCQERFLKELYLAGGGNLDSPKKEKP